MPKKIDNTAQAAPAILADILEGDGHRVPTVGVEQSQTLVLGQVVGYLPSVERVVALNTTEQSVTRNGDNSTTAFDLGHADVDVSSVKAEVAGAFDLDFTISRGTGGGGVDQIVFATAPPTGASNTIVKYKQISSVPYGVMAKAITTAASEFPTAPVVVSGGLVRSKLTNVPADNPVGSFMGQCFLV